MSIAEFAAEARLTPRTIRTYHTRGLLQPPLRVGRGRYYGDHHLGRIRLVQRLQQSGLTLDAVAALLEPDHLLAQLAVPDRMLGTTLRANPELSSAMLACGLLARLPDGSMRVRGTRAVLAAIALRRPGVSAAEALQALVDATVTAIPSAGTMLADMTFALRDRLHADDSNHDWLRELALPVLELAIARATAKTTGVPQPRDGHRDA
ncbi:MAG TPA: helix-turn-helix domain-containing protein [Pseudonocardiaceae bacterium]